MFVHERIAQHALERPTQPAMIVNDHTVTFAALERYVAAMAVWLENAEVRPGRVIGLTLPSAFGQLVTTLALLRIGAAIVPLSHSNTPLQCDELARRLSISLIVGSPGTATSATKLVPMPTLRDLEVIRPSAIESRRPNPDDFAILGHGSGTTGLPKIIPMRHRHVIARCLNISDAFKAQPGDHTIVLQEFTSLTFMARAIQCIFHGGCVVEHQIFRTRLPSYVPTLCRMIDQYDVAHVNCTAFHAQMIANGLPNAVGCRFPGLRTFVVGASTVSPALRKSIHDRVTPNLCISYGTNESGPISRAAPSHLARHPDTVGMISPHTEVAIVNRDGGTAGPGQAGSIRIRGESVIDGYYDDATATAASFRDGWFDTGDLGYLTEDGAIYLLGRNDDMMILNGFNIHPAEIERFLEQHPCVSEVAAVSFKSDLHGDIPMAFVVPKRACTEDELLSACNERLGVKAPRRIFFVEHLPRNAAGKVLRRELSQRLRVD